jgi:hypothetical protein
MPNEVVNLLKFGAVKQKAFVINERKLFYTSFELLSFEKSKQANREDSVNLFAPAFVVFPEWKFVFGDDFPLNLADDSGETLQNLYITAH